MTGDKGGLRSSPHPARAHARADLSRKTGEVTFPLALRERGKEGARRESADVHVGSNMTAACGPASNQSKQASVRVPVVAVGVMGMAMNHGRVHMPMDVRLARRVSRFMGVAMMLVVHMPMLMLHRRMGVLVLMPFGDVKV